MGQVLRRYGYSNVLGDSFFEAPRGGFDTTAVSVGWGEVMNLMEDRGLVLVRIGGGGRKKELGMLIGT